MVFNDVSPTFIVPQSDGHSTPVEMAHSGPKKSNSKTIDTILTGMAYLRYYKGVWGGSLHAIPYVRNSDQVENRANSALSLSLDL